MLFVNVTQEIGRDIERIIKGHPIGQPLLADMGIYELRAENCKHASLYSYQLVLFKMHEAGIIRVEALDGHYINIELQKVG